MHLPILRLIALLIVVGGVASASAPVRAQGDADVVRVRVLSGATVRTMTLRAHGGPVTVRADGRLVGTLAPGQSATVRASAGRVRVDGSGVNAEGASIETAAGYEALLGVEAGRPNRRYRGSLRVTPDASALRLVNALQMDDYVAAVVGGEYPFPEIEGIKAQAVLARTYALLRHGRHGDFDVVDTVMDQVYPGVSGETALTRRAVEETRGEVLAFAGGVAEVYYSSSNGGFTADNDAVWGRAPLPYLRARPDPYDDSPDARWTARLPVRRLHDALSARFGGRVTGFEVIERTSDGRARWVRLPGARRERVSGQDFRMMTIEVFGGRVIRSTLFEVRRSGDDYVFEGRGWGHGVGMSQYGARAQARQGRSYRDILAFYFEGTSLTALAGVAAAPGGRATASGGGLLDPSTPTDASEREALGIRTRPMTRAEREAALRGEAAPGGAATRIEERLNAGGWSAPERDAAETPAPPRRTAW